MFIRGRPEVSALSIDIFLGFAMYTLFFPDLVRDPKSGVGFRAYMQNGR